MAKNALVERAPTSNSLLGRVWSQPVVTRTNIEEALQLGLALLPADTQKRLVLLSDGDENTGDALNAARLAVGRSVPIDVVDLSGAPTSSDEAFLTALQAPPRVRDGQDIVLLAMVESTIDQPARLRIFADREVLVDREVQLAARQQPV
ncbi:MAG: VWA domain-containing protein, partial [Blastochloris sp.]|nr:VWA domain-containing protein [Blastochloris sp.]